MQILSVINSIQTLNLSICSYLKKTEPAWKSKDSSGKNLSKNSAGLFLKDANQHISISYKA